MSMEVNDWSKDLDEIDINEVNKNRTCELILVVEKSPADSVKLNMINAHSNLEVGRNLKCISLHSIYDFAANYKNDLNYVDDTIAALVDGACNEATEYLESETPIPLDLLTKILKLKIICLIMEDVFQYQKDAVYMDRMGFFEPPRITEGKGGKKKKDPKKGKPKASPKGKKTSKKGGDKPVEDPCLAYQTKKVEVPPQSNVNLEIEHEILYFVLIGFYAPQLLRYTFDNKMHVTSVVEFQEIETAKFETRTSTSSIDSKDFSQDQYYIYKGGVSTRRKQELYHRKKEILQTFWKQIYAYQEHEEVEKTFVMSYSPLLLKVQKKNPKVYINQCELLYNHFAEVMAMIKDYKTYHQNYLNSLDIYDLPEACEYVDVHCMSVYKKAMDEVPLDCMNVGILLEFLIDEVCNNLHPVAEVAKIGGKICKGKYANRHSDFRDQLKKTLEHFKCNNAAIVQSSRRLENESSLELDAAPYTIHESNIVEMCIKYYTYLPERILGIWVKSLMHNDCLKIWKQLLYVPERQSFNKEMKQWCRILEMSEVELYTAIYVFLLGQFHCADVELSNMRKDIEMYFPVRNIQLQPTLYPDVVGFAPSRESVINFYEQVVTDDFKFEENLPAIQMLQELHRAIDDFECFDKQYVAISDAILFRFHHKADEYGIFLNNWHAVIRTPISLNNFLSYVVHEDSKYILKQVKRHRDLTNLRQRIIQLEKARNTFEIKPGDFELRCSKYKKEPVEEIKVDESVSGKQSKKKAAGAKSKPPKASKPAKGGKNKNDKDKAATTDAREIVEGNKKIIDVGFDTLQTEPSLNYLPKLNAFNFGGKRIAVSGSTTAFYSTDELKVVVEKTKVCDNSCNLTLTVGLSGNDVIAHRDRKGFAFHIKTTNGTIAAFGPQTGTTQKRHQMYLLMERYKKNIDCLSHADEFKKKLLILAPLLQKIKRTLSAVVNLKTNRALEYASNPDDTFLTRKMFMEELVLLRANATEPKFRICSSRLHKYSYANRVKSPLVLQLKQIIRIFKSKKPKIKHLKLKSCHPVINKENCQFDWDVRFTLPNGLHIRNVPGAKPDLFYINQFYFQKGPQCATIADEKYRMFLRNGYVAVRKIDGTFMIYGGGGQIVTYEVPFVATRQEKHNCIFKKKMKSIRTSQNVLKSVRQKLKRLLIHTISSYRCGFKQSRRAPPNGVKKCPPLQQSGNIKNVFNFITTEGKKIKIGRSHITVDSSSYVLQQDEIGNNQQKFRRQDGTTIILNKEGYVQVTYSEATRVTSWYTIESQCINIDLTKEFGSDTEIMGGFTYIHMHYQYEHPNYATVIFSGYSMRLLIPQNITFEHNPPENLLKIDNVAMKIGNGTVNLESAYCRKCNKQCTVYLNLKPLFDDAVSPGITLLKAADTYGKEFTVKYDGSCKRNIVAVKKRCSGFLHKSQPLQKFVILNRDGSGKLLWTEKMFKNRMADVQPKPNEKIILYNSKCNLGTVEFRTLENLMYSNRFRMPYLKILIDDNDVDTNPVYVKQRILEYIQLDQVLKLFDKIKETPFQTHKFNVMTQHLSFSLLKSEAMMSTIITDTPKPVKSSQLGEHPYEKRISEWKEQCARIHEKIDQHRRNNVYPYFNLRSESLVDIYDEVVTSKKVTAHYADEALNVLVMQGGKESKGVSATDMSLDAIAELQRIRILRDVEEREGNGYTYTPPVEISSPPLANDLLPNDLSDSFESSSTHLDEIPSDIRSDMIIEIGEYVTTNLIENLKGNGGSEELSLSTFEESEECGMESVTKKSDSDETVSLSTMLEHDVFNFNTYNRVKRLFDPSFIDIDRKIETSVRKLRKLAVRNDLREIHEYSSGKQGLPVDVVERAEESGNAPSTTINESLREVNSKYLNDRASPSSSTNPIKLKDYSIPYIRQARKKFDVGKYFSDTNAAARDVCGAQETYDADLLEAEETEDLDIKRQGNVSSYTDEHSLLNVIFPERSDTDIIGFEIKKIDSNVSTTSSTATITKFDHNVLITPSLQGVTSIYDLIRPDFIAVTEVDTGIQTDGNKCAIQQTDLYYDGKFVDEK